MHVNDGDCHADPKIPHLHEPPRKQPRPGRQPPSQARRPPRGATSARPEPVLRARRPALDGQGRRATPGREEAVRPAGWRADASGNVVLCVYYGTKPIEFEKGKPAIAVPSRDKLPALIDTLIAAAKAGELDELITRAGKPVDAPKSSRRAA
jgi:hypothetical protein